jgi:N-hydroxyarylamine O-acetyltransferase
MELNEYAIRVGYTGEFAPDVETLHALHLAHATRIPFENLDVLLRRPIRLDIESLWAKLVTGGRGGYCFEQNAVFAAVLEAIGFRVRRLAARVRMGAVGIRPRTHMLLLVEAGDERWLADVGFGSDGLLHPVALRPGIESEQFAWKYRVVEEGPNYVLQSWHPEGWIDLYTFGLDESYPVDYEVANHFTSTYPGSPFLTMLRVQLPGPFVRTLMVNRTLIERTAERTTQTAVGDDDAVLAVLAKRFGLEFPAGTKFPFEE